MTITITWKRVAIGLLLAGLLSNAWWAAAYRSQQIVTAHAAPIAPVVTVQFIDNKVLGKAQAGREAGDGIEQAGGLASHPRRKVNKSSQANRRRTESNCRWAGE